MSRVTEYLKWTRVQAKIASYTEARVLVRSPNFIVYCLSQDYFVFSYVKLLISHTELSTIYKQNLVDNLDSRQLHYQRFHQGLQGRLKASHIEVQHHFSTDGTTLEQSGRVILKMFTT